MKPDPKPQLSPKIIEINIQYHQSLIDKYQALILEEQAKIEQWQKQLSTLSSQLA